MDHQFFQIYFIGNLDAEVDRHCAFNLKMKRNIVQDFKRFFIRTTISSKSLKLHWHPIALTGKHDLIHPQSPIVIVRENLKSSDLVHYHRNKK